MVTHAQPAIEIAGLVRRFGTTVAVDDLTFDVRPGEIFGLLGHNGAGKTTTIRLANGVLARDAGTIRVLGLDPSDEGDRIRSRTGVLTETPSVDERLTARENLDFFGRLFGLDDAGRSDQVSALLDAFGLTARADERVSGYSRGMKQRVALARTLLHDPDILFLDEPTAALDPVGARDVQALVEGFRRDERRTVVLTTHNLVEAERLCDRVAILERGRAVAIGSPDELGRSVQVATSVEIVVAHDDRAAALELLRSFSVDAAADGERLRARLESRAAIPAVVAALVRAGIEVYRVADEPADLETAYFALVGGEGGEAEADDAAPARDRPAAAGPS